VREGSYPADVLGYYAEESAAECGREERYGEERADLGLREVEHVTDGRHGEGEKEEVHRVERPAHERCETSPPLVFTDILTPRKQPASRGSGSRPVVAHIVSPIIQCLPRVFFHRTKFPKKCQSLTAPS